LTQYILAPLSFLFALYFTPQAIKIANVYGMLDRPDGKLKTHKEPVPYLGGIAVFLSFMLSLSLLYNLNKEILGFLFASTIILFTGFVDDLINLSPLSKLLGEFLAIWILLRADIRIKIAALPDWLAIFTTIVWILVISNGFNLIDIMDGLAGAISFFSYISFAFIAIIFNAKTTALVGLSLAGAVLGFLLYNLPPAKIYLGDTGSLFLGFSLATISIMVDYTAINPLGYFVPLFFLWIPIFEVAFVSIIRVLKGINPLKGSPDHFPFRLAIVLGSKLKALELITILHFTICLWGIIIVKQTAGFTLYSMAMLFILSTAVGILISRVKV